MRVHWERSLCKSIRWAPVAYNQTNKAEMNYHSFELEMFAIVRAIERFHIYLYGIEFTVVTDWSMRWIKLNSRITRWTLSLQNYRFKLMHRKGMDMLHVDALSRAIAYVNAMPLERENTGNYRIHYKGYSELELANSEKFELFDGLVKHRIIRVS